jgi:5-methylcytosine-specific restriction protein A
MTAVRRPCLGCSELIISGSRCRDCKPKRTSLSATQRGYGAWWQKLSREARRLQPFCTDCHRPHTAANPLTLDHTPAAWQKLATGDRLNLRDVANGLCVVRCMPCNNAQGAARGANVTRA